MGNGSVTPCRVNVDSRAAGISSSANDAAGGRGGVELTGDAKSLCPRVAGWREALVREWTERRWDGRVGWGMRKPS
ncbi:hypothetical protein GCM10023191_073220 [Actinoallomurus oryzae]|uniref:Uncharacterized protein n=1 Tax=Actinoallomurus oryzae TaxID=502180 RepID=A0ABP8QV18_9ACTN